MKVYALNPDPMYVGEWVIGGTFRVKIKRRPRWLTRVLCKLLLEWEWRDD